MKKTLVSAGIMIATTGACSADPGSDAVGRSSEPVSSVSSGLTYNLGTLAHPGACMDAQAGGTANGTQIQEWWCNGSGAQSYKLQDAGGGAFTIVNTQANKCVDVNARGTANGTKIQLYDCNGTPAQTFRLEAQSNGFFTIVNTNANKCLDVAGDNPADGTVVQLYDCNGTNAQMWNPAAISGSSSSGGSSSGGNGSSSGGNGSSSGGNGSGVFVHVANDCPIDLWIHGEGQEGVMQPDNVHLSPGASQDYEAPLTWTAARIYGYMGGPQQGQNDKVEMNFTPTPGGEAINSDITYVDWVALPSEIQVIGSGNDCTTVGCEQPFSQILAGCPASLVSGRECLAAGNYCLNPVNNGDPFCHLLDGQVGACASEYAACAGGAGSTTAQVYSCSGGFFSQNAQWCAALNRGVLSEPGAGTPASAFYQSPPYNQYSQWVHNHCPGIYAFPYDDYGSSNQSSDHTCSGATRMNLTFCPRG